MKYVMMILIYFFECYLNTINKKWSIAYLNLPFFNQLLQSTIKQKIVLIQAFQKKEFVGCSIHFIGEKILYGRYWGCLKEIPFYTLNFATTAQ